MNGLILTAVVIAAAALAYALLKKKPGRTCATCGGQKVDRGFTFKCDRCDLEVDPRPVKQADPQWWQSEYWEKNHGWPKDEPKDPQP